MSWLLGIYGILSLFVLLFVVKAEIEGHLYCNDNIPLSFLEVFLCILAVVLSPITSFFWVLLGISSKFTERFSENHYKTYEKHQAACFLKIGNTVVITRICEEERSGGWTNIWTSQMSEYVGEEGVIVDIVGSYGITVKMNRDGKTFNFPFFVLKKAPVIFAISDTPRV